jgi:RNA polymerase sigma-B factor
VPHTTAQPSRHDTGADRDTLILTHSHLARAIARRYTGRGVELDDLVQTGYLGLIQAVDRFDRSRGVPLEAYAARVIEGEILHLLRDRAGAVRVPRRLQELGARLAAAEQRLSQGQGRMPTSDELAAEIEVDVETVEAVREARRARITQTLSAPSDDEDAPVEQRVAMALSSEDEGFRLVDDRDQLRKLLGSLPARDRRILMLRYGSGLTQSEIAREVGISQMHVSRRLRACIDQLRVAAA